MKIGILDPLGKNKNPLNNNKYSDEYIKFSNIWSNFPAYKKAKEYIDIIKKNQVILVISGTGSGKTVLFPKYALHSYNYSGKIAITLPKQIITKSAAEFSAKTLDVKLGNEVGYKYKGHSEKSINTKLLYATDGTIVSKLLFDPLLQEFDCVIIDEAHERKVQIDFLLYLLKETLKKRKKFKIIIMSATINNNIFENYFKSFKYKKIDIGGETNYKIESIFLKNDIKNNDFINKGIEIILDIINSKNIKNYNNDILFFITSTNEAKKVCNILSSKNNSIFCIEVYAGMDKDKQLLAQDESLYRQNNNYKIKVVIATNVAESSLTIKGIKYVIDSGYQLNSSFDIKLKGKKLIKELISNAQAKQRMGRAGRTSPGICYHLYTENTFNNIMKTFPDPDIRTEDITTECLKLLNNDNVLKVKNLKNLLNNFIEPPKDKYINFAIENLNKNNLIVDKKISKFGEIISDLNIDIILAIPIFFSVINNCFKEVINIISIINASNNKLDNIFYDAKYIFKNDESNLKTLENKIKQNKKQFYSKYGDHISLLNLYNKFKNNMNYEWCNDNYLNFNTLLKSYKYAKNLNKLKNKLNNIDLNELKINYRSIKNEKLEFRIIHTFLQGYKFQDAKKVNNNYYQLKYLKSKKIKIDQKSFILFRKNLPDNIYYHELFINESNKTLNIILSLN